MTYFNVLKYIDLKYYQKRKLDKCILIFIHIHTIIKYNSITPENNLMSYISTGSMICFLTLNFVCYRMHVLKVWSILFFTKNNLFGSYPFLIVSWKYSFLFLSNILTYKYQTYYKYVSISSVHGYLTFFTYSH